VEEPGPQVVATAVGVGGPPVEPIEILELLGRELAPGYPRQPLDRGARALAFLAKLLALAALERGEEVVERGVIAVAPVKLQRVAREVTGGLEPRLLGGGAEQPVNRRTLGVVGGAAPRARTVSPGRRCASKRPYRSRACGAAMTSLG
jgi:hypothetical protein